MEESSMQLFLRDKDPNQEPRPRTFSRIPTVGRLQILVEMTGLRCIGGREFCEFKSDDSQEAPQLTPLWTFGATSRFSSPSSAGLVSESTAVKNQTRAIAF